MSRDKYLVTHVIKKPDVPPVGFYWPGHKAIDADLRTPVYGDPEKWDGHSFKQSINIKQKEFARSVASVCPRIDRSLVKYRDHQIREFKLALGQLEDEEKNNDFDSQNNNLSEGAITQTAKFGGNKSPFSAPKVSIESVKKTAAYKNYVVDLQKRKDLSIKVLEPSFETERIHNSYFSVVRGSQDQ